MALLFVLCVLYFEILLFPFSNLFATHLCEVYTSEFQILTPVRELSQGRPLSVLKPPYKVGKLRPNLFCSKNQQCQGDDGYTPIVKSGTFSVES